MDWLILIAGAFNVIMGLATKTKDFGSSLFFKIIPFFLGLGLLYYATKIIGVI